MPVNVSRTFSLRVVVTVKHRCGHSWKYPTHPSLADADRAQLSVEYAVEVCPKCKASQRHAETRERNKR
jgi:hypothetical protein